MSNLKSIPWSKEKSTPRSFSFQFSTKLQGVLKRKGVWSPEGVAHIGPRQLSFKSNGKANMHLVVFDRNSEKELGSIDFYWNDFQRSKLTLASGAIFHFHSFNLFRGVWAWLKQDTSNEQVIFRVDNPLHRSGSIEYNLKDISAEERDVLLLLGLQLQHYLNTWLMTIVIIIIGVLNR